MYAYTVKVTRDYARIPDVYIRNRDISDGAYRFYCLLAGHKNGANFPNTWYINTMGKTAKTLKKYKKELEDAGLLSRHRVAPRTWEYFLGSGELTATEVQDMILKQRGKIIKKAEIEAAALTSISMEEN